MRSNIPERNPPQIARRLQQRTLIQKRPKVRRPGRTEGRRSLFLHVNCQIMDAFGGFHDGFGDGWVGVHDAAEFVGSCF